MLFLKALPVCYYNLLCCLEMPFVSREGKLASSCLCVYEWLFLQGASEGTSDTAGDVSRPWHALFLAHPQSLDHLGLSDFYALHKNILQFISYYNYLCTHLQCHRRY